MNANIIGIKEVADYLNMKEQTVYRLVQKGKIPAIKSLAKSIQNVGDNNARLSSKEESLSLAISNTEATRSRIEDADFAKEQMSMMKLQILQQTSVSSFSQANSAPQMVLSLFR